MSNLEAFAIIMVFSIIFGVMTMCAFACLGLIELPRTKKDFERVAIDYIEYLLYGYATEGTWWSFLSREIHSLI